MLAALSWITVSFSLYAIPETNYEEAFFNTVLPFYESKTVSGSFIGKKNINIHYRFLKHPNEKAAIVIFPGRTESAFKYAEIIYDLYADGYSFYIMDYRGQGASGRLTGDSQISHVEDYDDYVADLNVFLHTVVDQHSKGVKLAIAHSMGANILSLFLSQQQNYFQAAALSSPMLDLKTFGLPQKLIWGLFKVVEKLGFGERYIPSQGPYKPDLEWYNGTHSQVRYRVFTKLREERKNELMGGSSITFGLRSLEATWKMREQAGNIQLPLLMFQAGNDQLILPHGQNYVCQHAKKCRLVHFPDAYHEILVEADPIRNRALQEIRTLFADTVNAAAPGAAGSPAKK
jgi:lysophospholipase